MALKDIMLAMAIVASIATHSTAEQNVMNMETNSIEGKSDRFSASKGTMKIQQWTPKTARKLPEYDCPTDFCSRLGDPICEPNCYCRLFHSVFEGERSKWFCIPNKVPKGNAEPDDSNTKSEGDAMDIETEDDESVETP